MRATSNRRIFLLAGLFAAVLLGTAQPDSHAQTLVLNGANMTIANGAYLVVDNPAAGAIKRNSGAIISEGQNNVIRWNIGTTIGTYVIPWGYGTEYIPTTFTKAAGTGTGYFLFSTFHTGWENSSSLPSVVGNFASPSGADKSALAPDRFWQINALNYTAKPALSNITVTYASTELSAPNNTTIGGTLSLQRWNSTSSTWNDFAPASNSNAANRTVTLAAVTAANNYAWWAADYVADRHWVSTGNANWNNTNNWSTTAGGAGGASVPATLDEVFFDDAFDAGMTMNANISVGGFNTSAGYSGTITQGTRTVTVANAATFEGGTFAGGSAAISIGGPLSVEGGTFTSTSGIMDVKGDLNVSAGTFNANNGTVRFSGTTATQSISSAAALNFNNISVTNTNSPGVSLQTNENLIGTLTLAANVHFDADGTKNGAVFTLISTADSPVKDAAIAILPTGAVVEGSVTVQRYMAIEGASQGRIYRYIASPVQNGTVADLQKELPITGTFTGSSACSGCTKTQSMFEYRESTITDLNKDGALTLDDGYFDFPDVANTETLVPGRGYAVYVRGNVLTTARWDLRGTINAGNVTAVTLPVTYTSSGKIANDGWNLVGNPFPSTIDWSATSGWTKTNMNNAVYVRDNAASTPGFATWNGVTGTNGGSRYIPMGQAFWVKASGAGTPVLRATENVKTPGAAATFFREAPLTDLLRVTLVSGEQRDETVVHFREDASLDFDTHADALKMDNSGFNLSSLLSDGRALAINSLASLDCNVAVSLNLQNTSAGSYSLEFTEFESFPASTAITLTDTWLGKTVDVRSQTSYGFQITKDAASYGTKRFQVQFVSTPASAAFRVSGDNTVCEGSDVALTIASAQVGASYLALSGADTVSVSTTAVGDSLVLTVPAARLHTLENPLSVYAQMPGCKTTASQAVTVNVTPQRRISAVTDAKRCGPGTVVLQALGNDDATTTYNWYTSAVAAAPIEDQHTASFTTEALDKSQTYYVSALYAGQCESDRVAVQAGVVILADAAITEKGDSLISNTATGNQWYFNDVVMPGATGQSIEAQQSGTYTVVVQSEGCSTSASRSFVITGSETQPDAHFSVFPNPVVSGVTIDFAQKLSTPRTIHVISEMGVVLASVNVPAGSTTSTTLNLSTLPAGIYILKVSGGDSEINRKIVKQ